MTPVWVIYARTPCLVCPQVPMVGLDQSGLSLESTLVDPVKASPFVPGRFPRKGLAQAKIQRRRPHSAQGG